MVASRAVPTLGPARALIVLALTAACVVTTEVLFTRILSVSTWYGLAFVVLSLAMLGVTRGGLLASRSQASQEPTNHFVSRHLRELSLSLLAALTLQVCLPIRFSTHLSSFASLLLVALTAAWPFASGGAVIARLMADSSTRLPVVYAVDLASAAVGALLPIALLGPLSAPGAVCLIAAVTALASLAVDTRKPFRVKNVAIATFALVAALLTDATSHGFVMLYPKGQPRDENQTLLFEAWNALSHVEVTPFVSVRPGLLWSPSPVTPPLPLTLAFARIDGEAATPVYAFRTPNDLSLLRFDATTTAHFLRPEGTACVIGVGGGRDVIAAKMYGHPRVVGAEINPAMFDLLAAVQHRSSTLSLPGVTLIEGDGRAVFRRANVQCSVLQASLVDTWAATSAGAFAHSEATLYTREAWGLFLRKLTPNGVLTFSRWYDPRRPSETSRLVSLAVASLHDRGVRSAREHIALVASGIVATIIVSPTAFSATDIQRLGELETRLRHTLVIAPGRPATDPLLERLLVARSDTDLAAAGVPYDYDTSPPTDDRPFFFHVLSPRAWLHPGRALASAQGGPGIVHGNVTAMFELLATFAAVLSIAGWLLGPTLWRAKKHPDDALPGLASTVYFAALGGGFMLVEVSLVQRMHVVLGHPTYALVVVLAGLLVATGVGSAISPWVVRSRRATSLAAAIAGVTVMALPWVVIRPAAVYFSSASLTARMLWTGGCAALVGLSLGVLFPSGIRWLNRGRGTPLALAVNGATSVLGSIAAVTISVWFGIAWSFAVGGVVYLVAALAGPHGWPTELSHETRREECEPGEPKEHPEPVP